MSPATFKRQMLPKTSAHTPSYQRPPCCFLTPKRRHDASNPGEEEARGIFGGLWRKSLKVRQDRGEAPTPLASKSALKPPSPHVPPLRKSRISSGARQLMSNTRRGEGAHHPAKVKMKMSTSSHFTLFYAGGTLMRDSPMLYYNV